jgi:hypothetical protein
MKSIIDFVKRYSVWLAVGLLALLLVKPVITEIRTILLIILVESIALGLSGLAQYAYTKIDFSRYAANSNLGYIFMGVHICVGLVVLGVYIAQFSN